MLDAINRYQSALELLNAIKYIGANNVYNKNNTFNTRTIHNNTTNFNIPNIKSRIKNTFFNYCNKYIKKQQLLNSSWKKYLPPGFRSSNPVYCILAVIWYLLIIYMTFTLTVDTKDGINASLAKTILYRITIFIILIIETLWYGNYLDIRRKLPGMKNINALSFILTYIYGQLFLFILVLLLAIILTFLPFI